LYSIAAAAVQALSHRTLVMLMGDDPAKRQTEVISAAEPHVAFAYLKHLWHSDKKVIWFAFSRLIPILDKIWLCSLLILLRTQEYRHGIILVLLCFHCFLLQV